jgi:hypothetical protein
MRQLKRGDTVTLAGKWFAQSTVTLFLDNIVVGSATVNPDGSFTTTITVPVSSTGQHTITANDGISGVTVTVTREQIQTNSGTQQTNTPTPTPTIHPTTTATPSPTIPEYSITTIILLFILLTASMLVAIKLKRRN